MKAKGFTLIELMITVAVVAILARIAVPAYTSYLARGKVADAMASLADYRVKMEQYFQDNRNYGTAGAACSVPAPASQYFTYSCLVGTPSTSFAATATSIAGALGSAAGAYTYSINESNTKSTSKFKGSAVTKSCWLIRGNEC
jgi:type IV pilus assembly protein PilE